MSPTVSIDSMLQESEPPTSEGELEEEDGEAEATKAGSSRLLHSLFRTREHELDTVESDESKGDAPEGRRKLLVLSNSTQDLLKSFDPISVPDNKINESLSLGGVVGAPTELPYHVTTETMCPTWGPSLVPRRIEELILSEDGDNYWDDTKPLNDTASQNIRKSTKRSWPGRARHTQHQLVQLDATRSLDSTAIKVPPPDEAKKRRVLVNYGEERKNLRLVFETSSLLTLLHEMSQNFNAVDQYNPTKARITAYTNHVFPAIAETWGSVLQIYSPLQNLVFPRSFSSSCGEIPIPENHLDEGVPEADVLIYVEFKKQTLCSIDSRPQIAICHFDQYMRPLIGSLSICLEDMDVQMDSVYDKEMLHYTALLSQLVGRFLGLSPNLFKYFRNSETGQLWGDRKVDIACAGGGTEDDQGVEQEIVLSNIIQETNGKWEISTPTVKQVVRNHFDCPTLTGARLAAPTIPDTSIQECSFFDLDLRYHFDEDMTSISQNADADGVSPISLALLEDSSWYKANFEAAKTPLFGRGAGCGFLESSCISG